MLASLASQLRRVGERPGKAPSTRPHFRRTRSGCARREQARRRARRRACGRDGSEGVHEQERLRRHQVGYAYYVLEEMTRTDSW